MKKILLLTLIPLAIFAQESRIDCKSTSERTVLTILTKNSKFDVADFSIDKAYTTFNENFTKEDIKEHPMMVRDVKYGIFTILYEDIYKKLYFYALPKSFKIFDKSSHHTNYKFQALLSGETTDPRKLTKKAKDVALNKRVILNCTMTIALSN